METGKEFIKYCLVGVINTIAGLVAAFTCLNLLYYSYFLSTAIAYMVGIVVSFSLNKKFTFKNESKNHAVLFVKFVLTMLPGYIFSYYSGWLITKFIIPAKYLIYIQDALSSIFKMTFTKFTDNMAVLISMIVYLILGFLINKFFVFKQKSPEN